MNVEAIVAKLKRYPVAVGCAVLVVVLIGVLYLRGSRISVLEEERNQMDREWKAIGENKLRAVELKTHLEKLNVIIDKIDERLMSVASKAINYQYFYKLEKNSGVRMGYLNQSETSGQAAQKGATNLELFQPITFKVTAEGTFKQILSFLYEMQHGNYLTIITYFSCSGIAAEDEEEQDLLNLSLTVQVLGVK